MSGHPTIMLFKPSLLLICKRTALCCFCILCFRIIRKIIFPFFKTSCQNF
ncbi:hypothetical protein M153_9836000259 [Pseudoloma neurophilia]|uniref:Uncharacterized protein n=1 Tax=Pseudoloma neurophilia TaxID=146866 RepID=A0A0R0LY94_9MICR|nr:hypothetical protein M153_9836000259 [Pseudoloma neurophilia]